MELEEAAPILAFGYVAFIGFWLSGLSNLLPKRPRPVLVNEGFEAQTAQNDGKFMYEDGRKTNEVVKEDPVELKEAPWEAEQETFEDEETPKETEKEKAENDLYEDKGAIEMPDGKAETKKHVRVCPKCERKAFYIAQYDRYYCYHCHEYIESVGKKKEEVVYYKNPEGEVKEMAEEDMGEYEEDPLETKDEVIEKGTHEEKIEEKAAQETQDQQVTPSELEEEPSEVNTDGQVEHHEALKELEEEAQRQKKEEKARKQFHEQLEAPWKIEEELLNNEQALGETEKKFIEHVMAQDESKVQAKGQEEISEEIQTLPMESEKKEHAEESEEEELYECPICGYEIKADTSICPRCESHLD